MGVFESPLAPPAGESKTKRYANRVVVDAEEAHSTFSQVVTTNGTRRNSRTSVRRRHDEGRDFLLHAGIFSVKARPKPELLRPHTIQ